VYEYQSLLNWGGGGYCTIVGDKHERSEVGGAFTNLLYPFQPLRTFLGNLGLRPRFVMALPYSACFLPSTPLVWTDPFFLLIPSRSFLSLHSYHCINLTPNPSYFAPVLSMIQKGTLEVPIEGVFPFTEEGVEDAFKTLDGGRSRGKVVVSIHSFKERLD